MNDSASMISVAALVTLERAINTTLALDPTTVQRLATLEGKVIAIEIRGAGVMIYLRPQTTGLLLMGHFDGVADTTLRGAPFALLRMSSGQAGEGLFSGEVTIDGDIQTGQQLQRILHGLDIDWEEHISRLTGDVIGHQIGQAIRGITAFGRNAFTTFELNLGEYLQEERRALPTKTEVESFVDEVDTLRMAADRLDARIKRIQRTLHA